MVVYELYKLQNGAIINTKLNLTIDNLFLVPAKGNTRAHYVVDFKEESIENFKGRFAKSIRIFPNPVKSGSQNYETAEKIDDADLFYYFVSYIDKELEFTINYKALNHYSVDADEKVLSTVKQEKSKWDQLGYTDSNDRSLVNFRKTKDRIDKGINKIDATIFDSFLVAAKKEGVEVPVKLKENDFKVFRDIYCRKLKKLISDGATPKVEDYYTGEEVFQIWKNGWNEETLPSSPIIQTGENTGKVKQLGTGDKYVDPLLTKFQKESQEGPIKDGEKEDSASGLIDSINNKWKTMITDKFPPIIPLPELETRYKTQKGEILNDPVFLSYKEKNDTEKLEMLKSIVLMYNDSEMIRCGNLIRDNYSQLYFIYWEYLYTFLKMMDEKSNQAEKDQNEYNKLVGEWKKDFLNDFSNKSLSVESLEAVKKRLDELLQNQQSSSQQSPSSISKPLTQEFKNECERILKAWKELISTPWGKSYKELNDYLVANEDKVLNDPFFTSFKDRTIEESAWMLNKLWTFYVDEKDGIWYYINYVYGNGDNPQLMYNYYLLQSRFIGMINGNVGKWSNTTEKLTQLEKEKADLIKDKKAAEEALGTAQKELEVWTDAFGTLKPSEVKTEYDKPKEQHTADQLEKHTDYETIKSSLEAANQKITTLEGEKTTLTTEKTNLETKLKEQEEEIKKLKQQGNQEILKNKQANARKQIVLFYQAMGLDDDPIKEKYNGSFIAIIDKQMTLDNEERMVKAFKVMACICATEKVKKWSRWVKPNHLGSKSLLILKKIEKSWQEVEEYSPISKENNPFYLGIIDKWQEYKQEFADSIAKYGLNKRSVEIREIEVRGAVPISAKDLSEERTIFQIVKKGGIKEKLKGYLDWLKKEYPGASDGMEKVESEVKEDLEEYSEDKKDSIDWTMLVRFFTSDETITAKIKEGAEEKLKKIFTSEAASDDDIIKDLKTQPIDELLDEFKSYEGDEIAYTVELLERFYLEWLPNHIRERLKKEEPILTLNDLDKEEWKIIKQKIFTDLYDSWANTFEGTEIVKLEKKIGGDIAELDGLITKTRKAEVEKFEKWIKDNISSKTKPEELLMSEADIDKTEFSSSAKQQAKWKLQEKQIELLPETTAKGKIKKHLLRVKFDWERWDYLVKQKDQSDPADYLMALMFAEGSEKDNKEGFGKTVAQEMLPKITAAITKDTMEGYRNLDQEWGQDLLENGEVKYNEDRDYYEVWENLRKLLNQQKANQDAWMKPYLREVYGDDKFQEYEKLYHDLYAQIETQNK